ncbi:hypothetical protein OC846_005359 [Tilletia horrida]|uniref:Uncharacterized protein n=1 Tax=Tilletia horrida TaxID=155126 RepID=A0AAN6JQB1_9BASI|nr:hypothetical protein OC846_005359 [Tilletia horrida]
MTCRKTRTAEMKAATTSMKIRSKWSEWPTWEKTLVVGGALGAGAALGVGGYKAIVSVVNKLKSSAHLDQARVFAWVDVSNLY